MNGTQKTPDHVELRSTAVREQRCYDKDGYGASTDPQRVKSQLPMAKHGGIALLKHFFSKAANAIPGNVQYRKYRAGISCSPILLYIE